MPNPEQHGVAIEDPERVTVVEGGPGSLTMTGTRAPYPDEACEVSAIVHPIGGGEATVACLELEGRTLGGAASATVTLELTEEDVVHLMMALALHGPGREVRNMGQWRRLPDPYWFTDTKLAEATAERLRKAGWQARVMTASDTAWWVEYLDERRP